MPLNFFYYIEQKSTFLAQNLHQKSNSFSSKNLSTQHELFLPKSTPTQHEKKNKFFLQKLLFKTHSQLLRKKTPTRHMNNKTNISVLSTMPSKFPSLDRTDHTRRSWKGGNFIRSNLKIIRYRDPRKP